VSRRNNWFTETTLSCGYMRHLVNSSCYGGRSGLTTVSRRTPLTYMFQMRQRIDHPLSIIPLSRYTEQNGAAPRQALTLAEGSVVTRSVYVLCRVHTSRILNNAVAFFRAPSLGKREGSRGDGGFVQGSRRRRRPV